MKDRSGFSLIEMIVVVVIIAILASAAIPVLQNIAGSGRNVATKGALGAVRIAITTYRVSESANNRPATWPAVGQVRDTLDDATGPKVMQTGELPNNSWALVDIDPTKRANADNVFGVAPATLKGTNCDSGGVFGWCYNATNGEVWANTANNGGLGGPTENNF